MKGINETDVQLHRLKHSSDLESRYGGWYQAIPIRLCTTYFALWVWNFNFGLCKLFFSIFASNLGLNSCPSMDSLKPAKHKHLMKTIQKKVTTCVPVTKLTNQGGYLTPSSTYTLTPSIFLSERLLEDYN
jgi:hypothetical protein